MEFKKAHLFFEMSLFTIPILLFRDYRKQNQIICTNINNGMATTFGAIMTVAGR